MQMTELPAEISTGEAADGAPELLTHLLHTDCWPASLAGRGFH